MPTPDFEDWMARQEVDIEDTLTLEDYLEMASEQWGLKGGSRDVAADFYTEKYKDLAEYDIRPIEYRVTIHGEEFKAVRYAISEMPGLWGKWRAYEEAEERALAAGDEEAAELFRFRLDEMEAAPAKRKEFWQVPRREE